MRSSSKSLRVAVSVAAAILCGSVHAVDLVGAYRGAVTHDPTLMSAERALQAGREKAVQGRALLLPQVGLSASVNRVDNSSSDSTSPVSQLISPQDRGSVRTTSLQVVQPLYDPKASAEKRQLTEQSAVAEVHHKAASQDLVQRVAESYFHLLLARDSLRVVQAEKAAVGTQRDRAKARFEVGRGRITEVQESQARYDAVLAREISAASTLAQREAQFKELTGLPPQQLSGLKAGFVPVPPQPDSLEAWQQRGADQNTRVATRRHEIAISSAEADKYRLSARPSVDLVGSHSWNRGGSLTPTAAPDKSRSTAIGVQLTVPLYTGGAINSRLRESLAKREQSEFDLAAAQRDMRLQVQDAFLATKSGAARVLSLEQSVVSARTALEATALGRDVGTRTELDVLEAQQRLFASQLELAQGRTDYLLGRVRLAAAAGELRENDLAELNAYLEP
ncbi:type I secretion protein TolC [Ramlibacter henchirensis]|uniref:Type I secretion protein TolC n=1 Tax=Ramlibacter henchirensis TaxID=204072 RepID=A0A4Z0C777_9BURK|nr:TolC family outer membrane protein [Ramlibacter henchirensis]TFZ05935.1 type I secretion protein TolC [Ramlibacter henchirensis]